MRHDTWPVAMVCTLLLAIPLVPCLAGAGALGPNTRVNSGGDGYYQGDPDVVVGPEGNVYVVWEEWRHVEGSVYLARSTDGGISFEADLRVDPGDSVAAYRSDLVRFPCVAVDGAGIVYAAWVSWSGSETGSVYCARSVDQGVSFEAPVLVSDSDVNDRAWPRIAGDPRGGVYLVWGDFRNSEDIIDLYTSWSADGTSFTPNVKANLSPVGPSCTPPLPEIAVGDIPGYVYIVWRGGWYDRWISACRSIDGGATFEPPVQVSYEPWYYGG